MCINKADYLNRLQKELKGCDRALIQDAISDAEEHLTTLIQELQENDPTISEVDALQVAIDKYGDITEVSAEYRKLEAEYEAFFTSPSGTEKNWFQNFFLIIVDPAAWTAALYMFLSILTGIIYGTWAITGLSFSLPMLIFIIGIPLAGLFLLSIRGIALLEGRLVELLLGVRMPRKKIFLQKGSSGWQKFKDLVSSGITWKGLVYMLLQMPLGILYFTLIVVLISVSLGFIFVPVLKIFFLQEINISDIKGINENLLIVLMPLAGAFLLLLSLHLSKLLGKLHAGYAKFMLVKK